MDIKMPDGVVLSTDNPEVIESYVQYMGGVPVKNENKKSATKVASASKAE